MESKANDATQASKRPWRGILFAHIENIFKKMKGKKMLYSARKSDPSFAEQLW